MSYTHVCICCVYTRVLYVYCVCMQVWCVYVYECCMYMCVHTQVCVSVCVVFVWCFLRYMLLLAVTKY